MNYHDLMEKLNAYALAVTTMSFDSQTIAPEKGAEVRNKAMAFLMGEYFTLLTSPEANKALKDSLDSDDEIIAFSAKEMLKDLEDVKNIPVDEYVAFEQLKQDAQQSWEDAKDAKDYTIFEDDLIKLIETHKTMTAYKEDGLSVYESSLDEFEKGLRQEHVDAFFSTLEKDLVPFIDTVIEHQGPKPEFLSQFVDYHDQDLISKLIMEHLGYTEEFGYLGHTEHPFSSTFSINDTRITTHFHKHDFTSNIFSIIHEIGHSMYNHQVNPDFEGHTLANNMSYSMHESQSRLLENMIGRSKEFWTPIYGEMQAIIPKVLGTVDLDEFIRGINYVERGFIRIEADEITYPLHIMVRYDLEKKLFVDNIETKNLDRVYSKAIKDYLGLDVENASQGILQDVHWSGAAFGYFPTYALGTAYAAQFMEQMRKDIDVDQLLIDGNLKEIFEWLRVNIHQYSGQIETQTIIKKVSKQDFNPNIYIKYIKEKYANLLGIKLD